MTKEGKKKVGRPATGRTTVVRRLPEEITTEFILTAYYDWLPLLQQAEEDLQPKNPRHDRLAKLLSQMRLPPQR